MSSSAGTPPPITEENSDYSLFMNDIGNHHLSFENPNYHLLMDPASIDDHLNSNVQSNIPMSVFEELKLQQEINRLSCGSGSSSPSSTTSASRRRGYASMDPKSMGVDIHEGPKTELDNKVTEEKSSKMKKHMENMKKVESAQGDIESDKLMDELVKEKFEKSDGEEDTSSNSQEVVVKRRPKKGRSVNDLPVGWEKHEDEQGPYYWHVKSGTIQRELPKDQGVNEEDDKAVVRDVRSSRLFDDDFDASKLTSTMTRSCTSNSILEVSKEQKQSASTNHSSDDAKWKRNSMPSSKSESGDALQVNVRSLGWVELREEDLTPENSSKAVNRCIVQLSSGTTPGLPEPAGQWGEGKELILELSEGSLRLIQPSNGILLNSQPIHSIRVWGVGRDNGQDFAYVARDKHTRKHMCHVFRCENMPARTIANALRDICKKILIERSLAQSSSKITSSISNGDSSSSSSSSRTTSSSTKLHHNHHHRKKDLRVRPTSLGTNFNPRLQTKTVPPPESFPTPMEEPRKVIRCQFLGTKEVSKPCGMEILNNAIDNMMDEVPKAQWKSCTVAVAPSTVTIDTSKGSSTPGSSIECRVRFLSFLGIGLNPATCAFIMHTAQDTFVAHVFYCEPNAGTMCKTIEAACKLRYQKCLDARPQSSGNHGRPVNGDLSKQSRSSKIGSTLKNMWAGFTAKSPAGAPPPS